MTANDVTAPSYARIDHIAIAVKDLESAIAFYVDVLGFTLMRRLHVRGKRTGMLSAEIEHNGIKFVLCQGTEEDSQVSRLISAFGPGVAHIALEVDDVHSAVTQLRAKGLNFDTSVIEGEGLTQAFSARCANSGMSIEFIARGKEQGFLESNVQSLFEQLENANAC